MSNNKNEREALTDDEKRLLIALLSKGKLTSEEKQLAYPLLDKIAAPILEPIREDMIRQFFTKHKSLNSLASN